MIDDYFVSRLTDYFEPCELVELLEDITTKDVIYAFEDTIVDNEDILTEYMDHGR